MSKQKVTFWIEEGEVGLLKEKFNTDNQSEAIRLAILQSLATGDLEKVKTLFPYIGKKPPRIGREVVNAFEQSGCEIFVDLFCGSLAMLCYLPYGVGLISEKTTKTTTDANFLQEETTTKIYHYDYLGGTIHVTDKNGNSQYHVQYGNYGELRNLTDANGKALSQAQANLTYLYNGQYGVEAEGNGLYYMRSRYYNTTIKRFLNRDILNGDLTNAQSLNCYSYVQGNPVSYTDPFGLSPKGMDYWLKYGHDLLDLAGFIPGLGDAADFLNALWYYMDGDTLTAMLCLIAVIPILGSIASKLLKGGSKAAGKFLKYINEKIVKSMILYETI